MSDHPIYPHGPLRELAPGLWVVHGSLARNPLPRTMVVYRLPGGGLWIHSAIAMNPEGMTALEALGRPQVLVVPNAFHRLDAPFYIARYPDLKVVCPGPARKGVEKKVRVHGVSEEVLPPLGIVCHELRGAARFECLYELALPRDQRALVWADLLFNLPQRLPGFGGWITEKIGSSGFFGMTRIGRLFGLRDARVCADWLRELAQTPGLSWLIMGHGEPIGTQCAQRLREAAARLAP